MTTTFADVRLALRSMRRQPLFAAIVIATLALGIGANTAMFALVHATLLKPLPYQEPDRLVLAYRTVQGRRLLLHSSPDYYDYESQTPGFESLGASRFAAGQLTIAGDGRPEHVSAMQVSYSLFPTLGVKPAAGRWFTVDEDRKGAAPVAIISEGLARRRFGSAAGAVGQKLAIGGGPSDIPAAIVGVMPASYQFLAPADLFVPMLRGAGDGPETRQFHNWVLVGRLRPGTSIEVAQRQSDVVSARLQREYPKTNKTKAMQLVPLQEALLGSQRPLLMLLSGAVGLVLLIACANVAGLLVARGVARRSELAVRAALGASRGRIAAQLVTESLVLSVTAGIAGVVLSHWLSKLLPLAAGLERSGVAPSNVEAPVLLFALAVSLVTGLLSGGVPALRASSLRLAASLAPGTRATESRGGTRLRSVLVTAQVALSLLLLVGAGLLLKSVGRLATTDLGFKTEGLYAVTLDQPYKDETGRLQFQERLLDELAQLPGARQLSITSQVPFLHPGSDPPAYPSKRPPVDSSQERTALRRVVSPGYFKTLGIPLLAGRDLARTDRAGTPLVTVIDQEAAREFFPDENPIGQRLKVSAMSMSDPGFMEFEVVGVVGNAQLNQVGGRTYQTVYMSSYQFPMGGRVNVVLRGDLAGGALARTITRRIQSMHSNVAVDPVVAMDDIVSKTLVSPRVMAATLGAFSSVALLLAAIGLYGVLAFYVTERGHEIGVRMALGAGSGAILTQVLWRSAMMVAPGLAVGIAAARASSGLLRRFLYQVQPTDGATYVAVSAGLALVALAASAWPALRAARVNPVEALRGE